MWAEFVSKLLLQRMSVPRGEMMMTMMMSSVLMPCCVGGVHGIVTHRASCAATAVHAKEGYCAHPLLEVVKDMELKLDMFLYMSTIDACSEGKVWHQALDLNAAILALVQAAWNQMKANSKALPPPQCKFSSMYATGINNKANAEKQKSR